MDYDDMTWIVCDCHGDAMAVWHDPDDLVWIEFWAAGAFNGGRWPLRHRLQQAWKWVSGQPETPAGVVLNLNEARRLTEVLTVGIDKGHREDQQEGPVASRS